MMMNTLMRSLKASPTGRGLSVYVLIVCLLAAPALAVRESTATPTRSKADTSLLPYSQLAPGDADTTFGGDGIVTTSFGAPNASYQAHSIAIQSDGKIVAAGSGSGDFF